MAKDLQIATFPMDNEHPQALICLIRFVQKMRLSTLTKPAHPQTNDMVERFNGRISEIVKTTHFSAANRLQETMIHYLKIYNHHISQRNIGHLTPIQKLEEWQKKLPELFKKRAYDLSGLEK